MRAVVAYESMFGNTRAIAEAIAAGASSRIPVDVVPIAALEHFSFIAGDFVVLGAPTHMHGMPGNRSRAAAAEMVKRDPTLPFDPGAREHGMREWLEQAELPWVHAAAFDTRSQGPRALTGSAARAIARRLRRAHANLLDAPQSFYVTGTVLAPGELDRARAWGAELAERVPVRTDVSASGAAIGSGAADKS